jgi:hypothetical protein
MGKYVSFAARRDATQTKYTVECHVLLHVRSSLKAKSSTTDLVSLPPFSVQAQHFDELAGIQNTPLTNRVKRKMAVLYQQKSRISVGKRQQLYA